MSTMLQILGAALAKELGRNELICCGLLRLSVMEHLDPANSGNLVELSLAMKSMSYAEWKAALNVPSLTERLISLGVEQPTAVINQLKQTLTDKQSLLTLAAR